MKALVVDDSAMIRKIIVKLFNEFGVEDCTMAESGEVAVDLAAKTHFDVILCDWNMPQMSGLDVLQQLRATTEYESTPFIVITSEISEPVVNAAKSSGATDFIGKPFSKPIFERKVIGHIKA